MLHQKSTPDEAIHHIEQMELLLLTSEEKQRLNQIMSLDYLIQDQAIHELISQDLKDKKWIKDTQVLIKTCYAKIEKNLIAQHHITECHNFVVFRFLEEKLMTCELEVSKQIGSWMFNDINRRGEKSRWISQKFIRNFEKSNIGQLFEYQMDSPCLKLDLSWLNQHRDLFFNDDMFIDLKKRIWSNIEHNEQQRQSRLQSIKKEPIKEVQTVIETRPNEKELVEEVISQAQTVPAPAPNAQSVKDLILTLSFDPSESFNPTYTINPTSNTNDVVDKVDTNIGNENNFPLVSNTASPTPELISEQEKQALNNEIKKSEVKKSIVLDTGNNSNENEVIPDFDTLTPVLSVMPTALMTKQTTVISSKDVNMSEKDLTQTTKTEEKKIPKFSLKKHTQSDMSINIDKEQITEISIKKDSNSDNLYTENTKPKVKFGAKKQEAQQQEINSSLATPKSPRFGAKTTSSTNINSSTAKKPAPFGTNMKRSTEDGFSSYEQANDE